MKDETRGNREPPKAWVVALDRAEADIAADRVVDSAIIHADLRASIKRSERAASTETAGTLIHAAEARLQIAEFRDQFESLGRTEARTAERVDDWSHRHAVERTLMKLASLSVCFYLLFSVQARAELFPSTNPYHCIATAKAEAAHGTAEQDIRERLADCMSHVQDYTQATRILSQEGFAGASDHLRDIERSERSGQYDLARRMLMAVITGTKVPCLQNVRVC